MIVLMEYVQFAVSICTLIGLIYAFYKFAKRPQDTIEERVSGLEQRVGKLETTSKKNTDDIDRVTTAIVALVDFEIAYCISTHYDADGINDLMHAKKVLRGEVDY